MNVIQRKHQTGSVGKNILISIGILFALVAALMVFSYVQNYLIKSSLEASYKSLPALDGCSEESVMYIGTGAIDTKPYYQVYFKCGTDKTADDFRKYVEATYASNLGEKHPSHSYYNIIINYYYMAKGNIVNFSPYQTSDKVNRITLIIQRPQDRQFP